MLPSLFTSGPLGVSRFLITMRSIDEKDKEAGILMLMSAGSLLAGLLSPPTFGSVLDDCCKYRKSEGAACEFYNTESMRKNFFLGVIILVIVVVVIEVLIFIFGKDLELYSKKKKKEVVIDSE